MTDKTRPAWERCAHVTPINDLREHLVDGPCWCEPVEDEGVLVHNSMDEREKFERGERRPS